MPKLDALGLPEAKLSTRTLTITTGGNEDTVVLVEPDLPTLMLAAEEAEGMWDTWGLGENGHSKASFPGATGLKPSKALFHASCLACLMQQTRTYDAVEFANLFYKVPQVWDDFKEAMNALGKVAEERRKN